MNTSHVTFPTLAELRARGTLKWTQYPEDVLPLWVAESDVVTCPAVVEAIQDAVNREHFGYPARDISGLTHSLADFADARFGWRPNPDHIFPVADVVRGIILAVEHFTTPGSPIIVPTPAYMPFFEIGPATGRDTIFVDTHYGNLDLNKLESVFAKGAKADTGAGTLILCNPNNPLGFTYDADTLREITDLAAKYNARVISDEIHAPVVLSGTHTPTASVSDVADAVTITVTATSKGWNTAGLKCAQLILNDADAETWHKLPHVTHEGSSILGQVAAEAAYRNGVEWLDNFNEVLRENSATVSSRLNSLVDSEDIAVDESSPVYRPNEASYLAWLDIRPLQVIDADRPAEWLREHAKVALNPGTAFGKGGAGHVRLNFATSPAILSEALDRIEGAIRK